MLLGTFNWRSYYVCIYIYVCMCWHLILIFLFSILPNMLPRINSDFYLAFLLWHTSFRQILKHKSDISVCSIWHIFWYLIRHSFWSLFSDPLTFFGRFTRYIITWFCRCILFGIYSDMFFWHVILLSGWHLSRAMMRGHDEEDNLRAFGSETPIENAQSKPCER
jgi:hypothetical protein